MESTYIEKALVFEKTVKVGKNAFFSVYADGKKYAVSFHSAKKDEVIVQDRPFKLRVRYDTGNKVDIKGMIGWIAGLIYLIVFITVIAPILVKADIGPYGAAFLMLGIPILFPMVFSVWSRRSNRSEIIINDGEMVIRVSRPFVKESRNAAREIIDAYPFT